MFEGTPDYPHPGIWWQLIEKYKATILYTSPTALRMCKKMGDEHITKYNLDSLKCLGSVGEPCNPEVYKWYSEVIGKNRCPISDTFWQTETGGHMLTPTPGLNSVKEKPGSVTFPSVGIDAGIVDDKGVPCPRETKGYLTFDKPWPGMNIGIYGDMERYVNTYWKKFPGKYFVGDYAI